MRRQESLGRHEGPPPLGLTLLRAYSSVRSVFKAGKRALQKRALLRFNSRLVHAGDLVFDVGGNYGEKTKLYRALGCRVVVVEPQEQCLAYLRKRFKSDQQVIILPAALGEHAGQSEIRLSDIRCQLSSMSDQWISAVKASGRFSRYSWSRSIPVQVKTLDSLVETYGLPAFCKIDVEGFEAEVLRGLKKSAVPSISWEFHVEHLEPALSSIAHVAGLGSYEFNFTVGNRTEFELREWIPAEEIGNILKAFPQRTLQGDIYARLAGTFSGELHGKRQ